MSQAQNIALIQSEEKRNSVKDIILKFAISRYTINEYQALSHVNTVIRKTKNIDYDTVNRATVIGRLSDLVREGKLYVHHNYNDGKNSSYKYEYDVKKQFVLSQEQEQKRYDKWEKNGEKHNYFKRHQLLNKLK